MWTAKEKKKLLEENDERQQNKNNHYFRIRQRIPKQHTQLVKRKVLFPRNQKTPVSEKASHRV